MATTSVKSSYGLSNSATGSDIFNNILNKFSSVNSNISSANSNANGRAQVAFGTFNGTGSAQTVQLSKNILPCFVICAVKSTTNSYMQLNNTWAYIKDANTTFHNWSYSSRSIQVSQGAFSISPSAAQDLGAKDTTFCYIAFG